MCSEENWERCCKKKKKKESSLSQIRLLTLISPQIQRKQSWFCFVESRKTTETLDRRWEPKPEGERKNWNFRFHSAAFPRYRYSQQACLSTCFSHVSNCRLPLPSFLYSCLSSSVRLSGHPAKGNTCMRNASSCWLKQKACVELMLCHDTGLNAQTHFFGGHFSPHCNLNATTVILLCKLSFTKVTCIFLWCINKYLS